MKCLVPIFTMPFRMVLFLVFFSYNVFDLEFFVLCVIFALIQSLWFFVFVASLEVVVSVLVFSIFIFSCNPCTSVIFYCLFCCLMCLFTYLMPCVVFHVFVCLLVPLFHLGP